VLDSFELPVEIGIIPEAHIEGDFENALVCSPQELRGCTHAYFVDILCHGATRRAFEESAERSLAHMQGLGKPGKGYFFLVVGIQVLANFIDALLIVDPACGQNAGRRKNRGILLAGQIEQD
jgi:hypothetical protein